MAGGHGSGEEGAQAYAGVCGVEEGPCLACQGDGEDDGVAGLVGGEAAEVWVGYCVLDADCEGQEEELGFDEGVDAEVGEPVLFEAIPR